VRNLTDRRLHARTLAVSLLITIAGRALAQPTPADPAAGTTAPPAATVTGEAVPDLAELAARGFRVGEVHLSLGNVFEKSEGGDRIWFFKMANRLHRTTRPEVIRRILLFAPGEPLNPGRIAESERLLRGQRLFYDARIVPTAVRDGVVDLEVQTRDVWSLAAGVGVGRSGGVSTSRFEVEDSNFLGTGKDLQFRFESGVDRDLGYIRYRDPNLLGSRVRLDGEIARANDGREKRFEIERPFYSLDTRWGLGATFLDVTRIEPHYQLGRVRNRYGKTWQFGEIRGGWSRGLVGDRTRRWLAGFTWDDYDFYRARKRPRPGPIPPDRALMYPWIGGEWIRDGYVVAHDLDKIERSEDLNLGRQASLRFGRTIPRFGSTFADWVLSGSFSDGKRWGGRHLVLTSATLWGRVRDSKATDTLLSGSVRYFWNDFSNGRLLIGAQLAIARDLDPDRQLLLGGDNGLRGYPLRYQQGDRLALLTVEQRVYRDREYFHLFRLGAAGFFDVGRAWDPYPSTRNLAVDGVLRDIGIGLRVSSSRSSRAAMVHFDVAYPLDGPGDISKVQWLVQTSDTF
jgi:hypothetical protein